MKEVSPTVISAPAPHFDDERTLQTARQVVPLDEIDSKIKHRRRWFLGGAFALAMMLGAASALLASYLKLRQTDNQATGITQVEQVEPAPEPVPAEETPITEPPIVASLEEEEEPEPLVEEVVPKKETRRRPVSRSQPDYAPSQSEPRISEEDELERIRSAVLYDEWQERRMRRALRRERRRAERNDRDLSNLDEIFEGRRRRINP